MRIEEVELNDFVDSIVPEWESFRRVAEPHHAFFHPSYVVHWLERLGEASRPRLVTAWNGDGLAGYAPFMETMDSLGPFREPTLRFVGNNLGFPGDIMYAEVFSKEPREEVIRAILSYAKDEWKVAKWNLGFLHPESTTLAVAAKMFGAETGDPFVRSQKYVALDLPPTFEAYLGSLSSSHRQNLRRRIRRLKEQGDLEFVVDQDPPRVGQRMREMLRNHLRWWEETDREDWFGDERTREFLVSAAERLASLGGGVFFTLELDGHPISWNVGCLEDERYFEQLISFDRDFASFSPGILLSMDLLRHLLARDIRRVELGPGLNERKRALGGKVSAYLQLDGYVRRPTWNARILRRLRGRSRSR